MDSVVPKHTNIGTDTVFPSLFPRFFTGKRLPVHFRFEVVHNFTVTDIIAELHKPGRDPRPEFKTAAFKEGVETMKDLEPGMVLEGAVTNVTDFGAFVDIGVHQDGLVHISQMSRSFVKSPADVVKAGDIVQAKVMSIDLERGRIALSMRLDDEIERGAKEGKRPAPRREGSGRRGNPGGRPEGRPQGGLKGGTFSTNDQPLRNNPFAKAFGKK